MTSLSFRRTVEFVVNSPDRGKVTRSCHSALAPDDESSFVENGFIVFPSRLPPAAIEELQVASLELASFWPSSSAVSASPSPEELSAGDQYLRDPHKGDRRFCQWLFMSDYALVDSIRCLLGPQIVLRWPRVRISRPGSNDGQFWHTDERFSIRPQAPFSAQPHGLSALVYLDDADRETGPLFVRPASYRLPMTMQPHEAELDLPDQIELQLKAGQAVILHAATWHRGGKNVSSERMRRVIVLHFLPLFCQGPNMDEVPPSPEYLRLLADARARDDSALLELLGALGGDGQGPERRP